MSLIHQAFETAMSNSLDISPALAKLNFNFSLFEVEAPKELGKGSFQAFDEMKQRMDCVMSLPAN